MYLVPSGTSRNVKLGLVTLFGLPLVQSFNPVQLKPISKAIVPCAINPMAQATAIAGFNIAILKRFSYR